MNLETLDMKSYKIINTFWFQRFLWITFPSHLPHISKSRALISKHVYLVQWTHSITNLSLIPHCTGPRVLPEICGITEERITNPNLELHLGLKENSMKAMLKPRNSLSDLATPTLHAPRPNLE